MVMKRMGEKKHGSLLVVGVHIGIKIFSFALIYIPVCALGHRSNY